MFILFDYYGVVDAVSKTDVLYGTRKNVVTSFDFVWDSDEVVI